MHRGGIIGDVHASRRVSAAVFANAPRMHRGGLLSDEVPIIGQKGERVLAKGEHGNVTNNYITIKALDSQDVQRALGKEKSFIADLSVASKRSNHPGRRMR
jgi:hypothetical protein